MNATPTESKTGVTVIRLRGRPQDKPADLAQVNGWSSAYAQGYVEGRRHVTDRKKPQNYAVFGIDEYCSGFRAGYFADARRAPDVDVSHANNNVARDKQVHGTA